MTSAMRSELANRGTWDPGGYPSCSGCHSLVSGECSGLSGLQGYYNGQTSPYGLCPVPVLKQD